MVSQDLTLWALDVQLNMVVTGGDQESKCRFFDGNEQAGSVMELQMSILINSLCDKSHGF